jgi:hypothetical protein
MDFSGLPPIPTGSFWKFFRSFQVLDFQGHFEALNKIFRDLHNKIIDGVRILWKHVYSSDIPFQWAIVHLK